MGILPFNRIHCGSSHSSGCARRKCDLRSWRPLWHGSFGGGESRKVGPPESERSSIVSFSYSTASIANWTNSGEIASWFVCPHWRVLCREIYFDCGRDVGSCVDSGEVASWCVCYHRRVLWLRVLFDCDRDSGSRERGFDLYVVSLSLS